MCFACISCLLVFVLSNKTRLTALQHQPVLGFWTAGIKEQSFFSQIFARLNTVMAWYVEFQCRKCGRWTAKITDRALKLQRWNISKETGADDMYLKSTTFKLHQQYSTMRLFSFNVFWLFVFLFFFPSFEMKLELITFPVSITTTTHRMRQSIIKPLVNHSNPHTITDKQLKKPCPFNKAIPVQPSQKKGVRGVP